MSYVFFLQYETIRILVIITIFNMLATACCFIDETDGEQIPSVESLLFDLLTIRLATANFSTENKIGEGGFGTVYMVRPEPSPQYSTSNVALALSSRYKILCRDCYRMEEK